MRSLGKVSHSKFAADEEEREGREQAIGYDPGRCGETPFFTASYHLPGTAADPHREHE
jgi:hypothetical protein